MWVFLKFILYGELPTNETEIAIKGFMTKNSPGTDESQQNSTRLSKVLKQSLN